MTAAQQKEAGEPDSGQLPFLLRSPDHQSQGDGPFCFRVIPGIPVGDLQSAPVAQQDLSRTAAVQIHGIHHAHIGAEGGHFGQGCAAAALSGNIAEFGSALRPEENRFSICVCAQGDPGGPGTGKVHRIQAGGIGNRLKMANAVDEEWNKLTLDIPFSLAEAPSEGIGTYIPVDADAIPGMIIGEATITETPLGISIRYMETATDEEAMYNIKKVEFDGLVYGQGGTVLEDDGNWWFTVSGCTGDVGDTLIARYYDWDDQLVGTIEFVKK